MLKRVLLSFIFVLALSTMAFANSGDTWATLGGQANSGANGAQNIGSGIANTGNNNQFGGTSATVNGGITNTATGGAATATATNTNTNTATGGAGGSATVRDSGNSFNLNNNQATVRDSGNSYNRNSNRNTNVNNIDMNQRQAQGQTQGQMQGQELSGNQSTANVSITQNGAPIPRNFAIPGTVYYPSMPSEFLNDTQFANAQPVKFILQFGCVYNRAHLENMKGDGWVKTLQLVNLYGNKAEPADTDTITFLTELPKDLKLVKIGSIVSKAKTGGTTTEQVLGDMGLEALSIKGAKYVLISGEGIQKYTKTSGWGVALGYTQAGISDDGQRAGTGTAGIGYSSGSAGREANPFIHGTVLTDEATFKELTSAQPK